MIDERWQAVRNVLLIRLDNLGDVLLTTPAFHAVRQCLPQAKLTLLASPVGAQVGALDPDIDEVLVYSAPWMDPWHKLPQDSEREQHMIAQVRAQHFDGAIIFTSFRQSPLPAAYLCYLAAIPLRVAASIDGPGSLLTTRHKHPERMMHEVERGLDLVRAIGMDTAERDLVMRVPEEAIKSITHHLSPFVGTSFSASAPRFSARDQGITANKLANGRNKFGPYDGGGEQPLIVVHPGCSMPARTYPWEMYAEVITRLVERLGAWVAITGAEEERPLVANVVERVPASNREHVLPMAGVLSFPELCALIKVADLTITNNTGPMHIAAAVKTPVIALFALTNPPEQWGPWQVTHRLLYHNVPCRICYSRICPYQHECLRLVSPASVVDVAAELLSRVEVAQ